MEDGRGLTDSAHSSTLPERKASAFPFGIVSIKPVLCVVTVCAVSLLGASAEIKFTIPVGKLFTYEVMRETFQSDFEPLSKLYGESPNPIHSSCFNINLKMIGLQVNGDLSDIVCVLKRDACTTTP